MVVLHLSFALLFCRIALVSHALREVQPGAVQAPPSGPQYEALSKASDLAQRPFSAEFNERRPRSVTLHLRSDSSTATTVSSTPFRQGNRATRTGDVCWDNLPGFEFVASVCLGKDRSPQGYRIICTNGGPGGVGDTAQFRFLDGQCPPDEVCVDDFSIRVRRMRCERPEHTSDSPAKRRKTIPHSTLVKKSDIVSHDLATPTGPLGLHKLSAATPVKRSLSSRAIDRCRRPWAFLSSACYHTSESTRYRAYKVACSRRYEVQGPMGKKERSSIKFLNGKCLPEEICVDGHGLSATAYCVRQDYLIGLAQNGLSMNTKSDAAKESQNAQEIGTNSPNLVVGPSVPDRKNHAPANKRNSMYKRGGRTVTAQCPGQPRWHLVASGCDPTNHRKFWAVCAEPVPIWHIPHQVIREGECTEREICMTEALGGSANPIGGLKHYSSSVAKCVKLVDWVMMGQPANGAPVLAKRSDDVLAGQQKLMGKRGTGDGRVIDRCAGVDLWHIPQQIRTEGQRGEAEVCVGGRVIGTSIKGFENFERFAAKCVRVSEGQGTTMASGDRSPDTRTPSPPSPREPDYRPPTASSTSRNTNQASKERFLPPDSAAMKPRHRFGEKIMKWRPINRCPMKYPPADWLLWAVNCDPSSPRDYVMECKLRFGGAGPGHDYGRKVYLRGRCSENEICFQGRKPTSSKCVSHDAFADLVAGAAEVKKNPGQPLNIRQVRLANRNPQPVSGDLPGSKDSRRIKQCSGVRSHRRLMFSDRDSSKGLQECLFVCMELNEPKGHARGKLPGSGLCEESEICVEDEAQGVANCVRHESFVQVARSFGPGSQCAARRSAQPQSSLENHVGGRLIDHCVGDIAHRAVSSPVYDEHSPRTYGVVCMAPATARLALHTDEYATAEICASGNANTPRNASTEFQSQNHGMARCVQQEVPPNLAQLATRGGNWRNQSLVNQSYAAQAQRNPSRNETASSQLNLNLQHKVQGVQNQADQDITTPHRHLDKRRVWRRISECSGSRHTGWTPLASDCTGEGEYAIWCSSPNGFVIDSIQGRCSDDEICVSGSIGPQPSGKGNAFLFPGHGHYTFADCVQHEGFNRLAHLATKKSATDRLATKGAKARRGNPKRALEKLADGRPLNQCPEDPRLTVWTSTCHPNEPRTYFISCRNPRLDNFIHRTGRCLEDEICVSGYKGEVRSFPIRPSEYWHYGIAKCVKLEKFIAAVEASKGNEGASTNKHKNFVSRQINWRPINECPGALYLPIVNSVCDPNHPRRYFVTCERPEVGEIYGPEARGVEQRVGECEEDEVCVSSYRGPPPANVPNTFMYDWHRQYGIAHCVKHESFSRIGELVEKYKKMELKETRATAKTADTMKRTETIQMNEPATKAETAPKMQTTKQRRSLEEDMKRRPTNRYYGYPHWKVQSSDCDPKHPQHPTNKICVPVHSEPAAVPQENLIVFYDHGTPHCVKLEAFARNAGFCNKHYHTTIWAPTEMETVSVTANPPEMTPRKGNRNLTERAERRPRMTEGKARKKDVEKRSGWRPIDQCPGGFTDWTFMTSMCDSKDPRKFWTTCHAPYTNGRFGPSIISRPDACSTTEICVSGHTGEAPEPLIRAHRIRNFGTAKCVSQQSFVRIARMVKENRRDKEEKRLVKRVRGLKSQSRREVQASIDSEMTINASTASQKVQQADPGRWIQTPPISRPLNVCPEPYRSWTVISSSCNRLGGNHQHFRMWCSRFPYVFSGPHVRLKGRCSNDEVCVPGAGGVETIPHPRGRKQGLTDARMAACVSVERISRIAKVMLDRKSKVDGRSSASAGSDTAQRGLKPAVTAADLAETYPI